MEQDLLCKIPGPLLAWYDKNARVLPWRQDPQPYYVWVSEIMLQQTRVEAVKPYFDRFITALPTVAALAEAPEEQLLKLWEGLGYYNRVRNLHKAAKIVMENYHGQLPADFETLLTLPGIGKYSAGAIASIAYGIPMPAVDGNVLRVTARVLASEEDITKEQVIYDISSRLQKILPRDRVGDFNQALMELGALICLPVGKAQCLLCPLRHLCRGYEQGIYMELPKKAPKKQRRIEDRTVFVIISQQRVLIAKRGEKGLLAGLWELPNTQGAMDETQCREYLFLRGAKINKIVSLGKAKHIFSHVEWHMTGYGVYLEEENFPWEDAVWASARELGESYALPTAFKAYTGQIKKLLCE
ncbi:A/G-specific adenine glycosylase [Youxingia wuxianensis]|uniref:Adenine DNA glycosylase n=1 Tax=Youxingia wuxianensis TaxID=2763678 RepID=A0A926ELH8_9FIRM|nr:A/G-specific adenine glycosylase [Youxingia wuxianensis]MBC8584078.1 A/G-specific adenine glycosylase [Youxingia wuxianensis]